MATFLGGGNTSVSQVDTSLLMFEDGEKALAAELLTSSTVFNSNDVKAVANLDAVSVPTASKIISNMEGAVVKLDKDMKKNILHKKALVLLAKEKKDPSYNALLELYSKKQKIFNDLESKYGAEARVNEGSLIGKLITKIRGSKDPAAMEAGKKIADFQ